MKRTSIIVFIILIAIACNKQDTIIKDNIEENQVEKWIAPSVQTATSTLTLAINMANSETESMALSNYKKRILEVRDRFILALKEVEKESKSKTELIKNINAAIPYIEENINSTKGIITGFTSKQNEDIKKYNAYSVTILGELNKLIK